jgi:prephenate dehydrogenase
MRQRGVAGNIVGYVRRPATVDACRRLNSFDRVELDLAKAVSGADLVILCTPIGQMLALVKQMAASLCQGILVTDVGSVKSSVIAQLEPEVAKTGAHFIGSHPMAGREKTGVEAAQTDLFDQATCAITPTKNSSAADVDRLITFWRSVGMRTVVLAPELHDELVARCSHLPHLVAAALVNMVLATGRPPEQAQLCGPGFRDTTRVASGSPEMWRDICQANRNEVLRRLDELLAGLTKFRAAVAAEQWTDVETFLREAQSRRDSWLNDSGMAE